ncbi:taurine ABC transporter substrate-binding protein [Methylobacterium platani]|uniref:Taurine ABC transporter substrate-binding protein n=2 Tax=Methylobacterium platani TaxID=427683 RepID=A0A179S6K9_9HYPH|nr:taurine ABC transporter substrate-binding protein [Methylobacterium platani]KMO20022.1 taurine ABC transporter substrate-binding protein [Methylobacterium platani JCM 14648]OAS22764.1 taurine ABC transporter substrate-binding protein [Methylobacterium platani]
MITRKTLLSALAAAALVPLAGLAPARAAGKSVTIAYQDMTTPIRVMMESGELEKRTGTAVKWVKFATGADVVRAMASGSVDIGESGSAAIAAAASQGLPIKLFWILDDIGDAEQLVARKGTGIASIKDLKGKTVAVPFVSTAHYQLMFALQEAGLGPKDVRILNMRPPEIAAAWERGDIDATFVWAPVLTTVKKTGTVLASAGDFAAKGKATFDGIVATDAALSAHRDFLVTFARLLAAADADYAKSGRTWNAASPQVAAIAKWTGAAPAEVPDSLAAYRFPTLAEQASPRWLGGGAADALRSTAEFLKAQGRVPDLAPDYGAFVTAGVAEAALKP